MTQDFSVPQVFNEDMKILFELTVRMASTTKGTRKRWEGAVQRHLQAMVERHGEEETERGAQHCLKVMERAIAEVKAS